MATGENFIRISGNRYVAPIKVSKKIENEINVKIKALQDERETLYADDSISDHDLYIKCVEIDRQIADLIDSKY